MFPPIIPWEVWGSDDVAFPGSSLELAAECCPSLGFVFIVLFFSLCSRSTVMDSVRSISSLGRYFHWQVWQLGKTHPSSQTGFHIHFTPAMGSYSFPSLHFQTREKNNFHILSSTYMITSAFSALYLLFRKYCARRHRL